MSEQPMNDIAKLLESHAWLSLALVLVPLLDKTIAQGEWPASVFLSKRVRLALIALGGGTVAALEGVRDGQSWKSAIVAGVIVVGFALLKNGQSLFAAPSAPAPPAPPAVVPEARASEPMVPDRQA
jgi:hypothetical protein